MTAYAGSFRLPVSLTGIVAVGTSGSHVPTAQSKVGKIVIKRRFIEHDYAHIPAFVVGVAT